VPDHGFHRLPVARVVTETADAASIVFDVPAELADGFRYAAGQFVTVRVEVGGEAHHRCYSMSSTPGVDPELQVTVKRVPGGIVSNWLLDNVVAGSHLDITRPAGVFTMRPDETEVVAFAGGSGITPMLSIAKAALAAGDRPVRLLYANRDRESVIFAEALERLAAEHGERLAVTHHLDVDDGFVDAAAVQAFLGDAPPRGAGYYLCGPAPFMDVVEAALLPAGVDAARIHVERFTPAGEATVEAAAPDGITVTIALNGKKATTDHRPGTTILQTARQVGMSPPFSCESGSCATCMARLTEGTAQMHVNDALTDDEVAEGWVLTCQAVPTSATVHVVYEP
jgi:3-ketosteroid 9alpha-monooxygenase subunit B